MQTEETLPVNRIWMESKGLSEIEILKAEVWALSQIVESLPVDAHDMDVHFWCNPRRCYALESLGE